MAKKSSYLLLALSIVTVLVFAQAAKAYVASSDNYRLDVDSINIGGTEDGTSASYKERDTIGEVATGLSNSASYNVSAGYRSMFNDTFVSISGPSDVTLSPTISGISGGTATGTGAVTVTTDASTGYTLLIRSITDPSLQSGADSFADYDPVGADPDYAWLIGDTDSAFGFSPEGSDLVAKYLDNGVACNTGALDTVDACWAGLSTTNETIAQSAGANDPLGTVTTLNFQAEVGANKLQPAGSYTATVIVTGLAN